MGSKHRCGNTCPARIAFPSKARSPVIGLNHRCNTKPSVRLRQPCLRGLWRSRRWRLPAAVGLASIALIAVTAVLGSMVAAPRAIDGAAAPNAVERPRVVGIGRRHDVDDRRAIDGAAAAIVIQLSYGTVLKRRVGLCVPTPTARCAPGRQQDADAVRHQDEILGG
jgi:hypothetical protein